MRLNHAYAERPIRFLELASSGGWRLKVYGIRFSQSKEEQEPDLETVRCAKQAAFHALEEPASQDDHYGVGFLIVHQGKDRNWILLDWWFDHEILKQRLYSSPLNAPHNITAVEGDLLACTWELAVIGFERQAWIEHVLRRPDSPDLEAYCAAQLNADL